MNQHNYPAAIVDFSRSIEIKPTDAAYDNRGTAQRALKKIEEAITDYTKSIEINPSAGAYYNRAVAYEENGKSELAFSDYTRAIELNPKLAEAFANRGLMLLRQGKDAEAERDLETAFQINNRLRLELEPYIKNIRATRETKRP